MRLLRRGVARLGIIYYVFTSYLIRLRIGIEFPYLLLRYSIYIAGPAYFFYRGPQPGAGADRRGDSARAVRTIAATRLPRAVRGASAGRSTD